MSDSGHGGVGTREQNFTEIIPADHPGYAPGKLAALAASMKGGIDTVKDGPDPEENLWVPAGYTYFGQFIDHDLTFDSTSTLDPDDAADPMAKDRIPTNLRTPRFDLDCLYGDGPAAQPFMYAADGATLLVGGPTRLTMGVTASGAVTVATESWDLLRSPNGRAIIGDKRNDENSIVSQIQMAFVRYHNATVERLAGQPINTWSQPGRLFDSARDEVRWTYQKLVLEDFLPRIVAPEVLLDLFDTTPEQRAVNYKLYTEDLRSNLPREFVAAAYRFGHSGVRTGYRLNGGTRLSIFPASDDASPDTDSLLGFDPLPKHHLIDDWKRFFSTTPPGPIVENRPAPADDTIDSAVRLQLAYKIDPTIVDPLGVLPLQVAGADTRDEAAQDIAPEKLPDFGRPSLALLNLLRANKYKIHGGQAYAKILMTSFDGVELLAPKYLCTRQAVEDREGRFRFVPIDAVFHDDTPLWFYILAEAQKPLVDGIKPDPDGTFDETVLLNGVGAKTQLGWVGGRIVAEVFYGLMDSDPDSYLGPRVPASWQPTLGGDGSAIMLNLVTGI